MPKFKFAKLIRDGIVDNQIAQGAKPKYRQLSLDEHRHYIILKIIEEVQEIARASPHEVAEEIADVQQALDDLMTLYKVSPAEVRSAQKAKAAKAGGFIKGIYEDYVEVSDDDPWVKYYRDNSDRYPEIP